MSLKVFSLQDKIDAMARDVDQIRRAGYAPRSPEDRHCKVLKAILQDLRARQMPRSLPLGELERALAKVKESKTALGYDQGHLIHVANIVISRWPFIQQALENFGAESAE